MGNRVKDGSKVKDELVPEIAAQFLDNLNSFVKI